MCITDTLVIGKLNKIIEMKDIFMKKDLEYTQNKDNIF